MTFTYRNLEVAPTRHASIKQWVGWFRLAGSSDNMTIDSSKVQLSE